MAIDRVTTLGVTPEERFDYWRDLFSACHIDRSRDSGSGDFHGRMLGGVRHDGIRFSNLRTDPLSCSFGRRDSDLILLGYVNDGRVGFRHNGDNEALDNGAMILFDCDRRAVSEATRYDLTYLELPRGLVRNIMGADPVPRDMFMRPLPNAGLVPLLRTHLDAMTQHWDDLGDVEAASALDAATSMAVALLSRFHRKAPERRGSLDDAMFAAAQRHIQAYAHHGDFVADHVAAALGCSRTHLYRIFGERGETIGGVLREVRLSRARRLIEARLHEPLGGIAFACGYTDHSAFGKAFRRRFGMSPTECREAAAT